MMYDTEFHPFQPRLGYLFIFIVILLHQTRQVWMMGLLSYPHASTHSQDSLCLLNGACQKRSGSINSNIWFGSRYID
jgi:hypothetical protein